MEGRGGWEGFGRIPGGLGMGAGTSSMGMEGMGELGELGEGGAEVVGGMGGEGATNISLSLITGELKRALWL